MGRQQPFHVRAGKRYTAKWVQASRYIRLDRSPFGQKSLPLLADPRLGAPRLPVRVPVARP
ncbi:MAG TPA: hypothetical protein VFW17_10345 [Ktedonobacterales bacterium]|nr:hypothetical protein [Ktedonobacterales bacterium]